MKVTHIRLTLCQLLCALHAVAQTPSDPSPRRGLQPTGSYEIEDIETLNKTNGNLSLKIPLGSIGPDRAGNSHGISLIYNSKIYEPSSFNQTTANGTPFVNGVSTQNAENGGWQYGAGYEMELTTRDFDQNTVCNYPSQGMQLPLYVPFNYKLRVVFPDGSKHLLRPSPTTANYFTSPDNTTNFTDYQGDGFYNIGPDGYSSGGCDSFTGAQPQLRVTAPMVYYTTDGTFIKVVFEHDNDTNPLNNPWEMYFRDGSAVNWGINAINATIGGEEISDHNGNTVVLEFYIASNGPPTEANTFYYSASDNYGRTISVVYGPVSHQLSDGTMVSDAVTATGYGATLTWYVNWVAEGQTSPSYTCFDAGTVDQAESCSGIGPSYEVSAVQIPNDPTSQLPPPNLEYTFQYNSKFGELTQVHLPYGATVDYTYELDYTAGPAGSCAPPATYVSSPSWWDVLADYPCAKLVTPSGCTQASCTEQSYLTINQDGSTPPFYISSNFQGPDGGVTATSFYPFSYDSASNTPWQAGLIYQISQPDGTVLYRTWAQNPLPGTLTPRSDIGGDNGQQQFYYDSLNPYIQSETRTWGSQSSTTTYTVDVNGNPFTTTSEPNWNSAATRTTTLTYMNSTPQASNGNGSVGPLDSNFAYVYWNYLISDHLSFPLTKKVSDSASGTITGDQFCYDPSANVLIHARLLLGTSVSDLVNCSTGALSTNAVATHYNWIYPANPVLQGIQDPRGVTTNFTYDSNYLYITAKYEACSSSFGTVPPCTLPEARTTQFVNDLYTGRVTQVVDADNHTTTTMNYDAFGRPKSITDATGAVTTIVFDDTNRFQMTTTPLDSGQSVVTENCYDSLGRISATLKSEVGQPLGTCPAPSASVIGTIMAYQFVPKPVSNDPSGVVGRYEWTSNPMGGSSGQSAPGWTRSHFDQSGRLVEEAFFSGSAQPAYNATNYDYGRISYSYTGPCVPGGSPPVYSSTTVTDQAGNTRTTCVDAAGRISSASDAGIGDTATYTYDVGDNLNSVTQGTQSRYFAYDPLGRLVIASNPESGQIAYFYDYNGNLEAMYGPNSKTCWGTPSGGYCFGYSTYVPNSQTEGYDGLNRPRSKSYTDGKTPTVTYTYDQDLSNGQVNYPKGHLVQSTVAGGATVQYNRFDAMGRVLRRTQMHPQLGANSPFNFTHFYNAAGLQTEVIYPSGRQVITSYDNAGRVRAVAGLYTGSTYYAGTGPGQADISYWAHGGIYNMPLGNSLVAQWGYNTRLQPTQISLGSSAGSTGVRGLTLTYGTASNGTAADNGNLLSQTIVGSGLSTSLTQTYQYDQANRITSVAENSWNCGWNYDQYGNGWSTIPASICTSPVTPISASGYNTATNQSNVDGATPDPAGNLSAVGAYTFTYDAENRMANSTTASGLAAYQYDGEGNRIVRIDCPSGSTGCDPTTPGSSSTWYIYDANGKLASEYSTTPITSSCRTCYVLPDHLGSIRVMTNSTGNPTECHDYQPFGGELQGGTDGRGGCYPAAPGSGVLFTGQYRDWETQSSAMPSGLDYFGARYFSGAMGRFTSADEPFADQHTSDPQSWNLYSYARNNPLRYFDPTGRDCITTDGGKTFHDENAGENTCATAENAQYDITGTAYTGKKTPYGSEIYERRNSGNRLVYESGTPEDWGPGLLLAGLIAGPAESAMGDAVLTRGSGPAAGILEVSDAYKSSKAVQNYSGASVEYVFDASSKRFVMGDMKHRSLVDKAGIQIGNTTVGGTIGRVGGRLVTTEQSGTYWINWTDSIRRTFVDFLKEHGVDVEHFY